MKIKKKIFTHTTKDCSTGAQKKVLAVSLATVMLFSMAGCGSSGSTDTDDDSLTAEEFLMENATMDTEEVLAQAISRASDQSGLVALTTERRNKDFQDDETGASVKLAYDRYVVNEATAETYPKLAENFEKVCSDGEVTILEEFDKLTKEAVEYAKKNTNASAEELQSRMDVAYYIVRSDKNVVSFYVYSQISKAGGERIDAQLCSNFNPNTGEKLTLDDVAKDKDALISYIKEELVKQYPDVEFDDLDAYFTKNMDSLAFLCRYDGVTFFFDKGEIASDEAGAMSISVLSDRTDLLNDEYLDYPEEFVLEIDSDVEYQYDADGDGTREKISITTDISNVTKGLSGYTISIDGKEITKDESLVQITPYVVVTKDGAFMYVEEMSEDETTNITMYDLSTGDAPEKLGDIAGGHAVISNLRYEWTDPQAILIADNQDVLGSYEAAKLYHVSETGTLETTMTYTMALEEVNLTTKTDLTLMEVNIEDKLAEVGDADIPAGTELRVFLTDGESVAFLRDDKAEKIYKVTVDKSGSTQTIDGESVTDLFEGIEA